MPLKSIGMKKILLALFAISSFTTINAQKKAAMVKAPAAAKEVFAKAHPGATGKWEKEDANYEVTFKESGKTMSCIVTPNGSILETETDMPVTSLPAPVAAYIAQHYKGVKVKEAATIVKADGTTKYEANVKGKDVMFDANGKLLSSKKEND